MTRGDVAVQELSAAVSRVVAKWRADQPSDFPTNAIAPMVLFALAAEIAVERPGSVDDLRAHMMQSVGHLLDVALAAKMGAS